MSPAIYAAARRSAALRPTDGFAPRTAATTAQQGITDDQNSNRRWIKTGGNAIGVEELNLPTVLCFRNMRVSIRCVNPEPKKSTERADFGNSLLTKFM